MPARAVFGVTVPSRPWISTGRGEKPILHYYDSTARGVKPRWGSSPWIFSESFSQQFH
jgi:hypothetical protein